MKQKRKLKAKRTNKGNPKMNNRHDYGKGHGKFGKKADRIARAKERTQKKGDG